MTESAHPGTSAGSSHPHRTSRSERRRLTEQRILGSARELFARNGFERTTIRAVAAAAEVDPALVMQYFGSKQELFAAAVGHEKMSVPLPDSADGIVDALLEALVLKMGARDETAMAMFRSMLTHPEAGEFARTSLDRQIRDVSRVLGGEEAVERAALLVTATLGVVIGQQLLGLETLRNASPQRLASLFHPAIRAMVNDPGEKAAPGKRGESP